MDMYQGALAMICIALIKYLDLEDPETIMYCRMAFATGSALTLSLIAFIYYRIGRANDTQELVLTGAEMNPPEALASMLGAPPAPDANKQLQITNREYDETKLHALLKSTLTTIVITTTLHVWKGFMPPLVLQSVLGLAGLCGSELAKIHVFGTSDKDALKALKRPWKAAPGFMSNVNELKKEMKQTMAPADAKQPRHNKKIENKLKQGKAQ